jgi:DNA adenine methylase
MPNDVSTFYEPFAGSAAASLCAAYCLPKCQIVLGDLHEPIASLWEAIIESPHDLADEYERLWNEQISVGRSHFNNVRRAFNLNPQPAFFLYLLARCVKAAIRYNQNGEFNNTADHRRRGARPHTMRDNVARAANILSGRTRVLNANYLDTLKDAGCQDVIYLDPPYQGTSGDRDSRYVKGLSFGDFCDGLEQLVKRKLSLIISYDGRIGEKVYGKRLPPSLRMRHFEVRAGRSTQETLLGRDGVTYESLYVSESLLDRVQRPPRLLLKPEATCEELLLFQ